MEKSTGIGNRENTLSSGFYKSEMEAKFKDMAVPKMQYKGEIAERAGFSLQYVRRWFREPDFVQKEIEEAAWAVLRNAKLKFQVEQESRKAKLRKIG